MDKNPIRILAFVFFLMAATVAKAQPGITLELPKPKKFENRKLASEKTGDKKFTIPRKFMQNTTSHYNYYFNANEKLNEVLSRAKADHKDDYNQLLSFYNYSIEGTSRYKNDLDSVIYKSTAGVLLHDLRSNWVDNMYLLIGKAYFFKKDFDSAYLTFQYLNYAFSPKEKDGYDKVIGSNSNEGGSAFSISTKEKRNIVQKVFTRPPSRNESLLWQIKTFLANDELPEAAGLIQTLRNDPLFPSRLKTDLEEVEAWYFYNQNIYDSAAIHLELALDNAGSQQEKARWEYLVAQLYEKTHRNDLAKEFYEKTSKHTIDPVLEVYSILNAIRQDNGTDEKAVQHAINELVKMARRDKYVGYRDIIYYAAAQMELDRNNAAGAKNLLGKSIKYSVGNPQQKSKSFLSLGDIAFSQKLFGEAKRCYDSVDVSIVNPKQLATYNDRKSALAIISGQLDIIARQDSLQKLAAMPQADRDAYIKKLVKQLRKQQGLKEEEPNFGNAGPGFTPNNAAPVDLFGTADKGDWYFSNITLKSKGFSEFRSKWGNRPNADNWRRSAALRSAAPSGKNITDDATALTNTDVTKPLSFESLLENVPTTAQKMKQSQDSVMNARFELGKALQDGLEDYPAAIDAYEKLLSDFPNNPFEEQTLFNLYYCYSKIGDTQKMAKVKSDMQAKFAKGKLNAVLQHPGDIDSAHKREGAALYDNIYNLFIEGKFDEALSTKHTADSLYGRHYWSPQLLYIESVYHIQQRNDSAAIAVLKNIVSMYPGSPMAAKSQNLINVLGRRQQIEEYLTNLKIERPAEDTVNSEPRIVAPVAITDNNQLNNKPAKPDSSKIVNTIIKPRADSVQIVKKPSSVVSPYSNAPDQPHYAVLVMDKVDPVYVSEARNAFNRYNQEKYYNKQIGITPLAINDDLRLILFGKFDNAAAALDYVEKARKLAASEIIPWMPAAKYSFVLITDANLEILKNSKDIPAYKKFLAQFYPNLF